MDIYSEILNDYKINNSLNIHNKPKPETKQDLNPFNYQLLIKTVNENAIKNNFFKMFFSDSLSVRDISHGCIRSTLFKLLNYPIENFSYLFLQLMMRNNIGNAIHNFIQSNYPFTEIEAAIKCDINNITFSGVIDALINNNILVEIKSLPYEKFQHIIKYDQPREEDLHQTFSYKFMLEKYIDQILIYRKNHANEKNFIKLDQYNIDLIQIIYIPHDIWLNSNDPFDTTALKNIKHFIKEKKNNKINDILMHVIDIDFNKKVNQDMYNNFITTCENKLSTIMDFVNKKNIPDIDHQFVNKNHCGFCIYRNICKENI